MNQKNNQILSDMGAAGVHIGHQKRRWNPRSKNFVYKHLHGISIINLEQTYKSLLEACQFLEDLASKGGTILFVGTKRQAQEIVKNAANEVSMPYCVNWWLGGYLTNFSTIQKSLVKYKHFLKLEADDILSKMHKKEASAIRHKMTRMHRNFEGILNMGKQPNALFVVDSNEEKIAVMEARKLGIPIVAMVDTNSDPTLIDYPIPANDDSVKSINLIIGFILDSVKQGLESFDAKKVEKENIKDITFTSSNSKIGDDQEPEVYIDPELQAQLEKEAEKKWSKDDING